MNYQNITKYDTANGPGIRSVLWVSGCSHYCKGCHNPQTWDPNSGIPFTEETMQELLDSLSPSYIAGITFSGGDPLEYNNRRKVTEIAKRIREEYPDKSIWMYTGHVYEDIQVLEVLNYIDVLVDGRFILELRDITLLYKGSPNQRVIDIKKSKESGEVVLWT